MVDVEELRRKINEYFKNVTHEQFKKDFLEIFQMPSSQCDVNIFGKKGTKPKIYIKKGGLR